MIGVLFERPILRALLVSTGIIMFAFLLMVLFKPVIFPILASFVLYALLQPLRNKLISIGFSDVVAILLILTALVTVLITSMILVIPMLIDQLSELQTRLPNLWNQILIWLKQVTLRLAETTGQHFDSEATLKSSLSNAQSWGTDTILNSATLLMQTAMALFLIPIITYFMLRDFQQLRNKLMGFIPNQGFELAWLIYYKIGKQLQRYLRGVMLQSTIISVIATAGFLLLGLDMALLFGLLTGLLNLIPYVGPLLSLIPPFVVTLSSPELDTVLLLGIPCVILLVQVIDNLFIVPTVIAQTVNLHPLVVLLGIVVFGASFGFLGMLLAIPAMTAGKIMFQGLLYGLQGEGPNFQSQT
ncbi:MAG: AI-2E family transporter [Gammaproteobacteria bacterium]|nr:AI-2E family transporter [Gammaproteobacteria bacterium]